MHIEFGGIERKGYKMVNKKTVKKKSAMKKTPVKPLKGGTKQPVKKKPTLKKASKKIKLSNHSFTVTDTTLTVSMMIDGEARLRTVMRGSVEYDEAKTALSKGNWDKVYEALFLDAKLEKAVKAFPQKFIKYKDGVLFIDGKPVPTDITDKVIQYTRENLPYMPLVRFWRLIQQNTSFQAVNGLFRFLLTGNFPITEDGHFIAYKGVADDFKDWHTRTMDNTPGAVVEITRNQCDEDPNNACSSGLHVASYTYATTHYGNGHIVEVKVNPMDVVAVPFDHASHKLRCCKYVVLATTKVERKEILATNVPVSEVTWNDGPEPGDSEDDADCDQW